MNDYNQALHDAARQLDIEERRYRELKPSFRTKKYSDMCETMRSTFETAAAIVRSLLRE